MRESSFQNVSNIFLNINSLNYILHTLADLEESSYVKATLKRYKIFFLSSFPMNFTLTNNFLIENLIRKLNYTLKFRQRCLVCFS